MISDQERDFCQGNAEETGESSDAAQRRGPESGLKEICLSSCHLAHG